MARTKQLINYAHLNDQHGDLSKCWFVEYSFRLPGTDTYRRKRVYDGLGTGTEAERRAIAARHIEAINQYLKSGEYLQHDANYSPVSLSDGYRPEQKRYVEALESMKLPAAIRGYIAYKQPTLKPKSIQDNRSKLLDFERWAADNLGDVLLSEITRENVCSYLHHLADSRKLCRKTIEKSEQVIRCLFDYAETNKLIAPHSNPVYKIPNYGRVIDCSPEPYTEDERTRLKNTISKRDPYLWLACEMIYYCAIRPGTELRLLRIKHINFESSTITIPADLAKNKRRESVNVPSIVMEQMELLHLDRYDPELYVFGTNGVPSMVPTGKNTMRNRFNEYRELLHISKDHKFYSWKHTGAISAISNGANPMELKEHLRHKSLTTTEEYIRKWKPRNNTSEMFVEKI